MFAGQMACEATNWILKRAIKEERPHRASTQSPADLMLSASGLTRPLGIHGKGYGMPSSHAQFVAFFSISLTLFLLVRHNPHAPGASSTHVPTSFFERLILSLLVLGGALAVAESRIYLNYHTPKQVLVGCIAGTLFALAWFVLTTWLRHAGWIDWALDFAIVKYFRMRDLVVNEDLVDAGWQSWQNRRRRRAEVAGKKPA